MLKISRVVTHNHHHPINSRYPGYIGLSRGSPGEAAVFGPQKRPTDQGQWLRTMK